MINIVIIFGIVVPILRLSGIVLKATLLLFLISSIGNNWLLFELIKKHGVVVFTAITGIGDNMIKEV